jgi:hypothetical protein
MEKACWLEELRWRLGDVAAQYREASEKLVAERRSVIRPSA